jgi:hypothetical protein
MLKRFVHNEFPLAVEPTPPEMPRRRPSRLRRIFDAIMEARQRKAELEIRRRIGWSNGPLSDEYERRITEHFMRNSTLSDFGHDMHAMRAVPSNESLAQFGTRTHTA